ncbi:DUF3617 domain-containing protein [Hansschlegelia zhihuaiae]|uniref:DUF3617 family protein n=1 Tax=Hansschlegelia zhihuaiae TaxID=405005 RepID=A0A4Q0MJI7_9HYPH|nr:DUF3617 family protein [Hansschlegelia zhihuaiae]RXF73259.1 hypothetical protein EK403_10485 [Hansschlegelia zhihuaiae]
MRARQFLSPIVLAVLGGLGLAGAAHAQQPPKRAPGLWETMTITNAGRSGAKECIDAATDRLVLQLTSVLTCRNTDFKRTADGFQAGAVCSSGGLSVDNRITVTGDFETWARAEALTTMSGLGVSADGGGARTFSTAIETRRIGDCEPGQIPGDLILPNGKTVHVNPSRAR